MLINNLYKQIIMGNYAQEVEILFDPRIGLITKGEKRQSLLDISRGKYIAFIDDDDEIASIYVDKVMNGVNAGVDVVGIVGNYYSDSKFIKQFKHSISCGVDESGKPYWEDKDYYYRCPNHLNPIKRELAVQAKFKDINHGEDTDFAMQLYNLGLLKSEYFISDPLYNYYYLSIK
jgi:glycosyltransferase involved in cell wall biosynthesis